MKGVDTATRRWRADELKARVEHAPRFREPPVEGDALDRICSEYTQATGDVVSTPKKRAMVATVYRVHGDDFIPFARDRFRATLSVTNLLGHLRLSPPRSLAAAADVPEHAAAAEVGDVNHSVGNRRPWTTEELADIDAEADSYRDNEVEKVDLRDSSSPEVAWRVEAMRPQYPMRGPIYVLRARPDLPLVGDFDTCVSCGDPLGDERPRCRPCSDASRIVLEEHR